MLKFEKPQKGNPHCLAIDQHTFPSKSIARFADANGRVQIIHIPCISTLMTVRMRKSWP
jgi:hypothetical protein